MKRNTFSTKVHRKLSNSSKMSLRMLLEEKEDEEDLFDMPEEEPKEDESGDEGEEGDTSGGEASEDESEESSGEEGEESADDTQSVSKEQLSTLVDQISAIKDTIESVKNEDGTSSVEGYISTAVSGAEAANDNIEVDADEEEVTSKKQIAASVKESLDSFNNFLNENMSIKKFIFEEDDKELGKIEVELDNLDRVLSKGTEVVNKFKKGKNLNIDSYVDAAINAYSNFDNLFSKELIIKQATINVLVLNSGAKARQNIAEFEEKFHEELHKKFDIEYEDHALITKNYNAASGAKSQG